MSEHISECQEKQSDEQKSGRDLHRAAEHGVDYQLGQQHL